MMKFVEDNKKILITALIVVVALSALYVLNKCKENFDIGYFKDPHYQPSLESEAKSFYKEHKTVIIVVSILSVIVIGGIIFYIVNKKSKKSMPEATEESEEDL